MLKIPNCVYKNCKDLAKYTISEQVLDADTKQIIRENEHHYCKKHFDLVKNYYIKKKGTRPKKDG